MDPRIARLKHIKPILKHYLSAKIRADTQVLDSRQLASCALPLGKLRLEVPEGDTKFPPLKLNDYCTWMDSTRLYWNTLNGFNRKPALFQGRIPVAIIAPGSFSFESWKTGIDETWLNDESHEAMNGRDCTDSGIHCTLAEATYASTLKDVWGGDCARCIQLASVPSPFEARDALERSPGRVACTVCTATGKWLHPSYSEYPSDRPQFCSHRRLYVSSPWCLWKSERLNILSRVLRSLQHVQK